MSEEKKDRKPRRTLNYADRLKEMDEAFAVRKARFEKRIADAEESLNDYKLDLVTHANEYATNRAEIVKAALAQAESIKRQVGGE